MIAYAFAVERLMDKTYTEARAIRDRISKNNNEWVDNGFGSRSMNKGKKKWRNYRD